MHRIKKIVSDSSYRLRLTFDDGVEGMVDLSELAGRGVFVAWKDEKIFQAVTIGPAGELLWPGDIDLCPDSLYLKVTGKKPEDVFPGLHRETAHA